MERLLKLLSLLQTGRHWSGAELAGRLGVTTRTVRRDVDRLRELGYPVDATQGTAGYRLGAGSTLPPLLLDDEEAVAVAIGLRTATASSVTGIEETSLRALSKLEQVLPVRLRHRVGAVQRATVRASGGEGPRIDAEVLLAISEAAQRHERLRIDYTGRDGDPSTRDVEPHTLVNWGRLWYLVAWDTTRDDWRLFRVDRLRPWTPSGPRFVPRPPPAGDAVAYVARQLATGPWRAQATVVMHAPAQAVAERLWTGMGAVEARDEHSCLLHLGAESAADLAWMVAIVGIGFTVESGPPDFADALRSLGERCLNALS